MLAESLIAFILILIVSSLIYILGRYASPKTMQTESEQSEYACGEKAPAQKLKINVTLYKFLIYFAIFDSTILLLAFATLLHQGLNAPLLILYLFIMFASSLILLEGAKD